MAGGRRRPYARVCADPEVTRHFPYVLTREESEAQVGRIVRHWDKRGLGLWAVEEKASGAFIGLRYNEKWSEDEHETEVGWRIDRAWRNRGLATMGARASLGYGFEVLESERIIGFTVPENGASRRIPARYGEVRLRAAGRDAMGGLNHLWYALDRRYWEAAEN